MGRIVHFEIHADDPERAVAFYTQVFGWTVNRFGDMDYWLLTTGTESPGIDGAILPRQGIRPAVGAPIVGMVNTIQVTDLDATLANAIQAGGSMALDKMAIPGVGTVAYIHDTEANVVGVLQPES
jgi:predicted enzyme related to lactoylglutathione lyase